MRRDLIIGIAVSLLVHGGAAWFGSFKHAHPVVKPKEDDTVQLIVMPKIEPEDQDVVDDTEKPPTPVDFAPPEQTDVPQLVTDTSFVQQLQPPPPDDVIISKNQIVIPQQGSGWARGIKIFNTSDLDQQPVVTVQENPIYPFEMRRNNISGQVVVEFVVDASGNVRDAEPLSSSQHEFESSAVQAVMKWKFKPGRKDGRPVATHMQVPINFNLSDDN